MDYESDPGWQYLRRSRDQILADQSKPYDSKKNFWIPDIEEGYVAGEIKSIKKDSALVILNGGVEKSVQKDTLQEMNPPKFEKTEDMSNLTFLNDASVLYNLKARYSCMLIYTYSGLFCVVINPYKRLPIYTDSMARIFMGKRKTEMPPHLFAVSDEAYRNMLQNHENQSMLITGESGAGKTENTKKVIAYFAALGASQQEKEESIKGEAPVESKKSATLEDKIVQTNPVLEAFGNAKTVRNNNSSRFGKFIRIHFTKSGKVASYLLEKSRVIRQAPGERCYHIFYQIFSGYRPNLIKDLLLDKQVKDYYFIAQAELTIDGINDLEEHQLTDEAFHVLNFSDEEINDCYKLVAAIMHMGNMKFKQRPREEQAETDGTNDAEKASKMYGITAEDFLKALLRPRVKVGTEWVNKGQNMEQVAWSVGAMAKSLYSRLFNWLVLKCNITLAQQGKNKDFFIGVLDIAGFEVFDFNSFEQLWINFVNEKLQQFFNHHMFVLEQEEYKREGIEWVFIDFGLDLQACIELIEKPMGIIAMLDEECIVPKASDNTLAQKLVEQHLNKHPNFEKPKPPKGKQAEAHFSMRHYAGTVRYNVTNWLEKNKDPLNDTLVTVMKASETNRLLIELWSDYTTQEEALTKSKSGEKSKKKGKSGSFMTVSMIYRESLNNLMTMLNTTHPHFIRCIIPNEKKQSGFIDAALVLNQLTCNGVLEGIRICRKGFPNRTLHIDFIQRYTLLAPEEAHSITKDKKNTKTVVETMFKKMVKNGELKEENFRVGATKVFFKAGIVAHIEDLRDIRLSFLITGLQTQIRWYCAQADVARRRKQILGLCVIQNNVRIWLQLFTWVWYKLYCRVKPLLEVGKEQEQLEELVNNINEKKEELEKKKKTCEILEEEIKKINQETEDSQKQLEAFSSKNKESIDYLNAMTAENTQLEEAKEEAALELERAEVELESTLKNKKNAEEEVLTFKKKLVELEHSLKKSESEKQVKENQIRSLTSEQQRQEATFNKLDREKKHQEEIANKLIDELKAEEERSEQEKTLCQKLQSVLESRESELDREKRLRSETDKSKRKLDGELRIAKEKLDELTKQRLDSENSLKRKEAELFALTARSENSQNTGSKSIRLVQEHNNKVKKLEAELENIKQARDKSERAKNELQLEADELEEQLDQQNAALAELVEINKKKDAESNKIKKEIEQIKSLFENQILTAKKKGTDGIAELGDQIGQLQRIYNKTEKEKSEINKQIHTANLTLDDEIKQKNEIEKRISSFESQLSDLGYKIEEQTKEIQDLNIVKNRLQSENAESNRQIDDLQTQIANVNRLKAQFSQEAEELNRAAADETREHQSMKAYTKNLLHELDQLKETLEEETASKAEVLRQINREQTEIQHWRHRFESENLISDEDAEESRRRQLAEIAQCQSELDNACARLASLECRKSHLAADVESFRVDSTQLSHEAQQLEKKQSQQEKTIDEWRRKYENLQNELDAAQRKAHQQKAEIMLVRSSHDQTAEQLETLRRENKQLIQEAFDLREQLSDISRKTHEEEATQRRLELEKDELQHALDEAEAALEAEESKVLRSQVELSQIRAEIEKRLQEKEEEFENIRKNHLQNVESLQSSLEHETNTKNELLRSKRKLESDIGEFQIAFDHAQTANEDAHKNIEKYSETVKTLQSQLADDQLKRDEFYEKYLMEEKRLNAAKIELSEIQDFVDNLNKPTKQMEAELNELRIQNNEQQEEAQYQSEVKVKLESELELLKIDLNEAINEVQIAQERSKQTSIEAARVAEELRVQQEKSNESEKKKKFFESQIRELQANLDEIEHTAYRESTKVVSKLENQLKSIENELENEQRRQTEVVKNLNKAERRSRELNIQVEEEKKNYLKLCELAEKLQNKIKIQRKMLEETENSASINLQKYRAVQLALDNAQERADSAESNLIQVRSRSRANLRGGPSSNTLGVIKSETAS